MAIAVEPNGNYGGVLGNQKYSPLTLALPPPMPSTERRRAIYAGLLVNRRKLLFDWPLAGPLSLAVPTGLPR